MVFLKDGFDDGFFCQRFTGLGLAFAFGFEIVDVEAQDVVVFDGVGDGVGVQLLLEDLFRGFPGGLLLFNLLIGGIFRKDGGAGKAEELGLGEKILDRLVVLAELRTVAFVKDEDDAFVAQRLQPLLEVALIAAIEGKTKLLNGGDNHLVGIIIGEQPLYQGFSVGVLFDAVLLKPVELLPRLPVEVFAVHHKKAFVNIRVILEQGGCLEGGERLATAGGVPDVAVAAVLVNALHDGLDGINLIGAHHHQLLLAGHQYHVSAYHFAQRAFGQKLLGKTVEMSNLLVVYSGKLVERQKTLISIKTEVAAVVVGEVPDITPIADDEELQEAEQGFAVAIAGIIFVLDNLLHGPAWTDSQSFQLDLYHRHTIDEEQHIIT